MAIASRLVEALEYYANGGTGTEHAKSALKKVGEASEKLDALIIRLIEAEEEDDVRTAVDTRDEILTLLMEHAD